MQHTPYKELFDFRPSAGAPPLLLILGMFEGGHSFTCSDPS